MLRMMAARIAGWKIEQGYWLPHCVRVTGSSLTMAWIDTQGDWVMERTAPPWHMIVPWIIRRTDDGEREGENPEGESAGTGSEGYPGANALQSRVAQRVEDNLCSDWSSQRLRYAELDGVVVDLHAKGPKARKSS